MPVLSKEEVVRIEALPPEQRPDQAFIDMALVSTDVAMQVRAACGLPQPAERVPTTQPFAMLAQGAAPALPGITRIPSPPHPTELVDTQMFEIPEQITEADVLESIRQVTHHSHRMRAALRSIIKQLSNLLRDPLEEIIDNGIAESLFKTMSLFRSSRSNMLATYRIAHNNIESFIPNVSFKDKNEQEITDTRFKRMLLVAAYGVTSKTKSSFLFASEMIAKFEREHHDTVVYWDLKAIAPRVVGLYCELQEYIHESLFDKDGKFNKLSEDDIQGLYYLDTELCYLLKNMIQIFRDQSRFVTDPRDPALITEEFLTTLFRDRSPDHGLMWLSQLNANTNARFWCNRDEKDESSELLQLARSPEYGEAISQEIFKALEEDNADYDTLATLAGISLVASEGEEASASDLAHAFRHQGFANASFDVSEGRPVNPVALPLGTRGGATFRSSRLNTERPSHEELDEQRVNGWFVTRPEGRGSHRFGTSFKSRTLFKLGTPPGAEQSASHTSAPDSRDNTTEESRKRVAPNRSISRV
ncbi:MAG: hypothetical protein CMF48_02660 [Legionellales bacterium]|nr:hypothetical protein [Legionellales bacterium]|tara:strand:+ start:655 stop:2247 length:1593 start_codon:yes stop_codon:yes gene_type:complete